MAPSAASSRVRRSRASLKAGNTSSSALESVPVAPDFLGIGEEGVCLVDLATLLGPLAFQVGPLAGLESDLGESGQLGGGGLAGGLGLGGEADRLLDGDLVDRGQGADLGAIGLGAGLREALARLGGLAEPLEAGQVLDAGQHVVSLLVVRPEQLLRLALDQQDRRGERLVGEAEMLQDPARRSRPWTSSPARAASGLRRPRRPRGGR